MEQLQELLLQLRDAIELYMRALEKGVCDLLGWQREPSWRFPQFDLMTVSAIVIGLGLGWALRMLFVPTGTRSGSRKGVPTVLLVGPPDSGKTSLFINLVQGEHPQTHTSSQVSDTTVTQGTSGLSKPVRLVDIPGHPRLKDEMSKHIGEARGVVFVVDIVALVRNAAGVAEQLPPLLTLLASTVSHRTPAQDPIQLLFLAHKSDLLRSAPGPPTAPPFIPESSRTTANDRLKTILTREMDRLKSARGSQSGKIEGMSSVPSSSTSFWGRLFGSGAVSVESTEGEDAEGLVWGGKGPFKWEDVEGVEVSWGCTALGAVRTRERAVSEKEGEEGDGLDDLKAFIEGL